MDAESNTKVKSKVPFSKLASTRDLSVERHYFGSGHGKKTHQMESRR